MSSGKSRRPADWVYRAHIRDDAGGVVDGLGSYEQAGAVINAGSQQVRILYDSFNFRSAQFPDFGGLNVGGALLGSAAKAEGRNPLIRRVEGYMRVAPSSWSIGSIMNWGIRFGIFEQDVVGGGIITDPTYNLLGAGGGTTQLTPANWANMRNWHHEHRYSTAFSDASQVKNFSYRFRVNRLLKPAECYAMVIEVHPSLSVNTSFTFWFRTLVSDEG